MHKPVRVLLALLLCLAAKPIALAETLTSYSLGIKAYQDKKYLIAVEMFKAALHQNNNALTWLYLAHAYSGAGDKKQAITTYQNITRVFAGTAEANLASQCLTQLQDKSNSPPQSMPGNGMAMASKVGLLERITVYPPRSGHPAVSAATVSAVKTAVSRLPPAILKILDKAGATITIAPNIEDKWPGSGEEPKPWEPDVTLGEEGGRTYGHNIHIYERAKERGSNRLKEMRSTVEVVRHLHHELGHAIDSSLDNPSSDPRFQAEMQADLASLNNSERMRVAPYQDPGECFSEVTGCLLSGQNGDIAADSFPHARAWIRRKLNL